MGIRGRRWSVATAGLQAGLSAMTSPALNRFPSSWPNTPENQDSVFDTRHQALIWPKAKSRSNSIGELFSGSWIKNNSSSEETPWFKAPRFSFSMFQVSSKNNQKSGLSIVTLVNGNTILVSIFIFKTITDNLRCRRGAKAASCALFVHWVK